MLQHREPEQSGTVYATEVLVAASTCSARVSRTHCRRRCSNALRGEVEPSAGVGTPELQATSSPRVRYIEASRTRRAAGEIETIAAQQTRRSLLARPNQAARNCASALFWLAPLAPTANACSSPCCSPTCAPCMSSFTI